MSVQLPPISALGTRWIIELFTEPNADEQLHIGEIVRDVIHTFEHRYSRFLRHSLVTKLNQDKILHNPDSEFIRILQYGLELYDDTSGVFNFLVGEELNARGYNASYSFTPTQPNTTQIIPNPHDVLTISDSEIRLTAGAIDLGGFGKGYLIDIVATTLEEAGYPYILINAGGDIYVTSDQESPVTIHLEHPSDVTSSIGEITLQQQGFAASSAHKRSWHSSGQKFTHIVHTTTPTHDVYTLGSYVIAKSAAGADALATTALLTDQLSTPLLNKYHATVALFDTTDSTLTSSAPLLQ